MKKGVSWGAFDKTVLGLRAIFLILGFLFLYANHERLELSVPFLVLWLLSSFSFPLFFWRPAYLQAHFFFVTDFITTGGLSLYLTFEVNELVGGMILTSFMTGYLYKGRGTLWAIVASLIFFPALESILIESTLAFISSMINYTVMFGIGISLNMVLQSQRELKEQLRKNERQQEMIKEKNEALIQYADQVERLTLLEERSRMARELHDTIGHILTSSIMGLDAVKLLISSDKSKAIQKVGRLRNALNRGLDETRKNIHDLDPSNQKEMNLAEQLREMCEDFASHTDTQVTFTIMGVVFPISETHKRTLTRSLQESLTNAVRHGEATIISVNLSYEAEGLNLTIIDNGSPGAEAKHGFGLRGMEERLLTLNGSLDVSFSDEGTTVTCTIPMKGSDSAYD
ncbi:hypothetical protein GCM10010954_28900 [Halobacillus andaensis]|uniref:histidine kinase n=1 Tax=Halobacillus andaensis TaxID=1176239 RepID=A0A917B7L2_HALAA|nr:sensor histidine kinase [Halobacillus andaensis]MBP2006523.1 signal transduction histidine kinase [Halobacillus andaensis]GGF28021.1 hypothetical protein GCM10010954_28900 [Halobacillus andaensis]